MESILKLYHLRKLFIKRKRSNAPISFSILPPSEQFREVLAAAKDRIEAANGRMYFVYLPSLDTFLGSGEKYRMHHDQVIAAVESLHIDTIDFLHQIDSRGADPVKLFSPKRPAHYSVTGYSLLRDVIRDRLLDDGAVTRMATIPKMELNALPQ